MTTARNRALDRLRQAALHARKQDELGADLLRLATYPMVQTLPRYVVRESRYAFN